MTLQGVLAIIQTAVGGVTGVKYAPDNPTGKAGDFPFVVTYLDTFRGKLNTAQDFRMLYSVRVELHIARKDLAENVYELLPYAETVANAIFSALVDNVIAHGEIAGSFGALAWGDTKTIGFVWTIKDVKVITNIT